GQGPPSRLLANKPVESFEVTRLRGLSRPGLEVIALHRRGEFRRPAEESPSFGGVKAGEAGRFEKCGLPVRGLDQRFDLRRAGGVGGGSRRGRWMGVKSRRSIAL